MAGDVRDHVLSPGEILTLRDRSLTALQALGVEDAQCAIYENEPVHCLAVKSCPNERKNLPRTGNQPYAI